MNQPGTVARAALFLGLAALAATAGCDADCDDPSRIDGTYNVFSSVAASDQITGENVEFYPLEDAFFNGWSRWELKYIPSNDTFQLSLDDQPFSATYSESAENCNTFTLDFQGTYTTEVTSHDFVWSGELTYMGTHLGGTWSYQDAWSGTVGDDGENVNGSINVPAGELNANIAGSPSDFHDDTGG